jgi:hypothetical protein
MHKINRIATAAQPAPQRFVRDVGPNIMPKPVSIYDAARWVIQAERMRLIDGYLEAYSVVIL